MKYFLLFIFSFLFIVSLTIGTFAKAQDLKPPTTMGTPVKFRIRYMAKYPGLIQGCYTQEACDYMDQGAKFLAPEVGATTVEKNVLSDEEFTAEKQKVFDAAKQGATSLPVETATPNVKAASFFGF